ncbi:unnamed protein product [Discula destructiva]
MPSLLQIPYDQTESHSVDVMVDAGALVASPLLELGVLAAHLFLPASIVEGYVKDSKNKALKYRLNGILVLVVCVLLWTALCGLGLLPWDYFYTHRCTTCLSACITGLLTSATLTFTAPPQTHSLATDFFFGRTLNPRFRLGPHILDIKMYLYVIGAVHLELNTLSFTAAHYRSHPQDPNPGVGLAAFLLSWFVVEYLWFEHVHLFTYDLFAERLGFKLAWGCLCFYPFFYPIGILAAVALPNPGRGAWYHTFAAGVYFGGWALSRLANLQKFRFKRNGAAAGLVIKSVDGRQTLFCGGLWGAARHVNYVGEIVEAVGIALAVGHPPTATMLPWAYPLYYVLLLTARERDDDARCREKYGELWEDYCRRVPYRLLPYVY